MLSSTPSLLSAMAGGGHVLIVPSEGTKVAPAYLPWLTKFDPDIIYSYVDLDEETVRSLHEVVGPSHLLRREFRAA